MTNMTPPRPYDDDYDAPSLPPTAPAGPGRWKGRWTFGAVGLGR